MEKAEALAAEKAAEELALKVAEEEKVAAEPETLRLAELEKAEEALAAEKAAEELALKVAAEEKAVAEDKATAIASVSEQKYTVQLLSLSKFSEDRLAYYCKKHKLDVSKVNRKQSGEWMKITYGAYDTKGEANKQVNKLAQDNGIKDGFVVVK